MITGNPTAERFEVEVAASDAALAEPRVAFEEWLREVGAEPDVRSDLAVVFSELLANAAHAVQDATTEGIVARAWQEADAVTIEVANPIPDEFDSVTRWDLDDPLRGGGRGLLIVRAYTDDLSIETVDGTIVVRCRRPLQAA